MFSIPAVQKTVRRRPARWLGGAGANFVVRLGVLALARLILAGVALGQPTSDWVLSFTIGDYAGARKAAENHCKARNVSACVALGRYELYGVGGTPVEPRVAIEKFRKYCPENADSCLLLARTLDYGIGIARSNSDSATKLAARVCRTSRPLGCSYLAYQEAWGRGMPANASSARAKLEALCKEEDLNGCVNLASLLAYGRGGERDKNRSQRLREAACARNSLTACAELDGDSISTEPAPAETQGAIARLDKACRGGSHHACSWLAWSMVHSGSTGADSALATSMWMTGCRLDSRNACYQLANFMVDKNGSSPSDTAAALRFLRRGCDVFGGPASCYKIAILLEARKKNVEAFANFRRGCQLHGAEACAAQGFNEHEGVGTPPNFHAAAISFVRGCILGSGTACGNVGVMIERHEGNAQWPGGYIEAYRIGCALKDQASCDNLKRLFLESSALQSRNH